MGGFVISQEKISDLVPLENASMPERTIIQWDKEDLESMHLLKVDVLALGMLTALRGIDEDRLFEALARVHSAGGLHLGEGSCEWLGCDLSREYIRINAEYTT